MRTRIENARRLRSDATDAERRLWYFLRNRQLDGHRFRRQVPLGPYIADFACIDSHLIVELDGSQHLEATAGDGMRTRDLERAGYRVLRFWNHEVMQQTTAVLEAIRNALSVSGSLARDTQEHR